MFTSDFKYSYWDNIGCMLMTLAITELTRLTSLHPAEYRYNNLSDVLKMANCCNYIM